MLFKLKCSSFKTLVISLFLTLAPASVYATDLWISSSKTSYIEIDEQSYVIQSYPDMKSCKKAEAVIQKNCETIAATQAAIKLTCEVGHIKASDGKSEINYKYQCIEE